MKNCSIATVGSKRYWSLNKIIRSRNIFFLLSLTHPYVKWRHQDDEDPMRIQNMNDSYLFWHTSQMLPIFDKLSSNSVISSDWLAGWLGGSIQFNFQIFTLTCDECCKLSFLCIRMFATAKPRMPPIHHTLKQNNYMNYKLLIRFGQMCGVELQCNHIFFFSFGELFI